MKKSKILIGIIGLVAVIILAISVRMIFLNSAGQPLSQSETEIFQPEVEAGVSLVIDDGEEVKNFIGEFEPGMTVFDLLEQKASETGLLLETSDYEIGVFIETIGEKRNGQDEKYWLYYVNDEMPMVSADKKEIEPGDKIEFKFEESPF